MDLKNLQKHIDEIMKEQNSRPVPEFEGYSPVDMLQILHFPFGQESPIKLQKLSDTDYKKIPLLNLVKYLTGLIAKNGEVKLTNKGFLPVKIVADLYHQGFKKESHIEDGIVKLYKESDSMSVNLSRIIPELAGMVKKRKGKISLTRKGENILLDDFFLLTTILETFARKFNWAYYDGYGQNQIGQLGFGFSLILLSKFGKKKRLDSFYAGKYLTAFPALLDSLEPTYDTLESYATRCYSIRTFERFLDYFGLVNIEKEGKRFDSNKFITKTDLFDKLIKIQ